MTQRSDLVTDIVGWTGHNFNDAKIASIIRIAESNIGRNVRVRAMYQTDAAFIIGGAVVAQPDGLIEVKRFRLSGANQDLKFKPPHVFYDDPAYDQGGTPTIYTMEGSNFVFAPVPSASCTGLLGYLKRFSALVASTDTNALLSDNYDIYLFACLATAFSFAQDDEQAAKWKAQYDEAVDSLNTSDQLSAHQINKLKRSGTGSF